MQRWFFLIHMIAYLSVAVALQQVQRYRARVAYDGAGFQGFQLQREGKRTVQGCLEAVLGQRLGQSVRLVGAGRTDTGVHARGQAIHFDLQSPLSEPLSQIEHSVNAMLPTDVCLWNLSLAPTHQQTDDNQTTQSSQQFLWNVLYNSVGKLYSYRLCLAPVMSPLERHHRWHPDSLHGKAVDIPLLQRLLKHYEGTHDFRAFAGAVEANQRRSGRTISTVRTVYSANWITEDEALGYYRIEFHLQGALYKQVRNMVGTAIDASRGIITEEAFRDLLHGSSATMENDHLPRKQQKRREDNKSKPAPPQGLTLEHVYFDEEEF